MSSLFLRVIILGAGIISSHQCAVPIQPVGVCEIDRHLNDHISASYPECTNYKCLRSLERKLRRGQIVPPTADVIEGTMPCQNYTTLRHMTKDSNYQRRTAGLFVLQCRVISYIMPSYVFLEMTSPDVQNSSVYLKVATAKAR